MCVYGAYSVAWVISHFVWDSITATVSGAESLSVSFSGLVIAAHLLFLALNLVNAVARASINYNSRPNCCLCMWVYLFYMPQSCWQSPRRIPWVTHHCHRPDKRLRQRTLVKRLFRHFEGQAKSSKSPPSHKLTKCPTRHSINSATLCHRNVGVRRRLRHVCLPSWCQVGGLGTGGANELSTAASDEPRSQISARRCHWLTTRCLIHFIRLNCSTSHTQCTSGCRSAPGPAPTQTHTHTLPGRTAFTLACLPAGISQLALPAAHLHC